MRGLELGMGAAQIALGLLWLVLLIIDLRREPARRLIQPRRFRPWSVLMGLWFLITGPWWIVRGLGG